MSLRSGKKRLLSAEMSDSGHDPDPNPVGFLCEGSGKSDSGCAREYWEDLPEVNEFAVTVVMAVVAADCGDEWAVFVVLVDLVEKRCLMKCQEEERALWVLNLGREGEEG